MLLRDLQILTMAPGAEPFPGSIRVEGERITALGDLTPLPGEEVVDLEGRTALPGFVQGHVHLGQTLFRNLAEDRPLLAWLRERIWPLEAAHDERSIRASTRLALLELVRGGCTSFQSMETVAHTDVVFEEVLSSGLRGILGNALMDLAQEFCRLLFAPRFHIDAGQQASYDRRLLEPRKLLFGLFVSSEDSQAYGMFEIVVAFLLIQGLSNVFLELPPGIGTGKHRRVKACCLNVVHDGLVVAHLGARVCRGRGFFK